MNFNEKNNHGIANEVNFAKELDKKMVKDLNKNFKEMLYSLFDNLKEDDYIECWKSKFNEKADIKIRINGDIKGISIKMGESNSVHQEHLNSLSNYLLKIGLSKTKVEKLHAYILGIINGVQLNAKTYKQKRYNDIIELKNSLADLYIKICLIIRFLFQGKENQIYGADAIIHGTPDNFLWATKSEIINYLITYPDGNTINVKVGPLFIQCRNRNLKKEANAVYAEEYVQVKWYCIHRDLYFITKKRNNQKKQLQNISKFDNKNQ